MHQESKISIPAWFLQVFSILSGHRAIAKINEGVLNSQMIEPLDFKVPE